MTSPIQVKALGEIAIRCGDLAPMVAFYRDVIGLPVLLDSSETGIVFFRIADGYAGHTTVLALFLPDAGRPALHPHGTSAPYTGPQSSFHHMALSVDYDQQDAITQWLDEMGIEFRVQEFDWIGWRGVFVKDPEGNTVELVAAKPKLDQ